MIESKLNHLLEFGGNGAKDRLETTIPFLLDDYIALVNWTGRAFRNDKRGFIPNKLPPAFERLGMDADDWLEAVKRASYRYGLAKGPTARRKHYAECHGKKWVRGQSYYRVFYQLAPD